MPEEVPKYQGDIRRSLCDICDFRSPAHRGTPAKTPLNQTGRVAFEANVLTVNAYGWACGRGQAMQIYREFSIS